MDGVPARGWNVATACALGTGTGACGDRGHAETAGLGRGAWGRRAAPAASSRARMGSITREVVCCCTQALLSFVARQGRLLPTWPVPAADPCASCQLPPPWPQLLANPLAACAGPPFTCPSEDPTSESGACRRCSTHLWRSLRSSQTPLGSERPPRHPPRSRPGTGSAAPAAAGSWPAPPPLPLLCCRRAVVCRAALPPAALSVLKARTSIAQTCKRA